LEWVICPVIRPTIAKGRVGRKVPLWWDRGTLDDVARWVATRRAQGAKDGDPVVCSLQPRRIGEPLDDELPDLLGGESRF